MIRIPPKKGTCRTHPSRLEFTRLWRAWGGFALTFVAEALDVTLPGGLPLTLEVADFGGSQGWRCPRESRHTDHPLILYTYTYCLEMT